MKRMMKGVTLLATMTAVPLVFMTSAFAATNGFSTQYENNLNQEQTLLTQAQSTTSSNSNVAGLITTAQNINTQTAALYTVEQTLASGISSIPQVNDIHPMETQELRALEVKRAEILKNSANAWKLVNQYVHHPHKKGLLKKALADHTEYGKQLTVVDKQIADLNKKLYAQDWKLHPYNGGLSTLQDSILKLQDSAIHYTKEAIALEQVSPAVSTTTTSSNVVVSPAPSTVTTPAN